MDRKMPGTDDMETTRKIRELGITMPIGAFTASTLADSKDDMLQAGKRDPLAPPQTYL